jgi:hypothetical protein
MRDRPRTLAGVIQLHSPGITNYAGNAIQTTLVSTIKCSAYTERDSKRELRRDGYRGGTSMQTSFPDCCAARGRQPAEHSIGVARPCWLRAWRGAAGFQRCSPDRCLPQSRSRRYLANPREAARVARRQDPPHMDVRRVAALRSVVWGAIPSRVACATYIKGPLMHVTPNKRMQLTAPFGAARARIGGGASCSPFGEHRRRS